MKHFCFGLTGALRGALAGLVFLSFLFFSCPGGGNISGGTPEIEKIVEDEEESVNEEEDEDEDEEENPDDTTESSPEDDTEIPDIGPQAAVFLDRRSVSEKEIVF
jgi:hypothetical protein